MTNTLQAMPRGRLRLSSARAATTPGAPAAPQQRGATFERRPSAQAAAQRRSTGARAAPERLPHGAFYLTPPLHVGGRALSYAAQR